MNPTLLEAAEIGRRLSASIRHNSDPIAERLRVLESTVEILRKTIERTERKIERYELGRSLVAGRPVASNPEMTHVRQLIVWVAQKMHVEPDAILSKCRRASLIWPRHLAMWIASSVTGYSLNTVGMSFRRDHSAIIYAKLNVERFRQTSPKHLEESTRLLNEWLEHENKTERHDSNPVCVRQTGDCCA